MAPAHPMRKSRFSDKERGADDDTEVAAAGLCGTSAARSGWLLNRNDKV